jgi:hypothetical protein
MLLIGVDPGLSGALSLVDSRHRLLACEDIPTCSNGLETGSMKRWVDVDSLDMLLAAWSQRWEFAKESVRAAIERPIPMPKLPAQTIASQFDTFGTLRAVIQSKLKPGGVHYVSPQAWKKRFGVRDDKEAARACCLRLYPDAPVSRVKDHNRAESVLIAHWLMLELA